MRPKSRELRLYKNHSSSSWTVYMSWPAKWGFVILTLIRYDSYLALVFIYQLCSWRRHVGRNLIWSGGSRDFPYSHFHKSCTPDRGSCSFSSWERVIPASAANSSLKVRGRRFVAEPWPLGRTMSGAIDLFDCCPSWATSFLFLLVVPPDGVFLRARI